MVDLLSQPFNEIIRSSERYLRVTTPKFDFALAKAYLSPFSDHFHIRDASHPVSGDSMGRMPFQERGNMGISQKSHRPYRICSFNWLIGTAALTTKFALAAGSGVLRAKDLNSGGGMDRVIMNLPHGAFAFFQEALDALRVGGVIHYYEITSEEGIESRLEEFKALAEKSGSSLSLRFKRVVRTYSPSDRHWVLDIVKG